MVKGEFEGSSVDVEKVVNNDVDTSHENGIGYTIRSWGFIGFEHVAGILYLLS